MKLGSRFGKADTIRAACLLLCISLCACAGGEGDPRDQITGMFDDAKAAAERRDVGALKEFIAKDYQDSRGFDRRALVRFVQGYMLRHRNLHLFTLVRRLRIDGEDAARARVFLAMAGRPIESADHLERMRAELMRVDLELHRASGDWQVASAEWKRASLGEMFDG